MQLHVESACQRIHSRLRYILFALRAASQTPHCDFKNLNMSSPKTIARSIIPFPNLPPELREMIYRYALLPENPTLRSQPLSFTAVEVGHGGDPHYLNWLQELCRVNEATRVDVSLFLLRIVEFIILYPDQVTKFTTFLESLGGNQGFTAVRRLDFLLFGRHQPDVAKENAYVQFIRRCPELTEITIKFDVEYMTTNSSDWRDGLVMSPTALQTSDQTRVKTLDDVITAYCIADLLDLKALVKLTIEAWPRCRAGGRYGVEGVMIDCTPLMERLMQWLREGFRSRGSNVHVRFKEAFTPGLRWVRLT